MVIVKWRGHTISLQIICFSWDQRVIRAIRELLGVINASVGPMAEMSHYRICSYSGRKKDETRQTFGVDRRNRSDRTGLARNVLAGSASWVSHRSRAPTDTACFTNKKQLGCPTITGFSPRLFKTECWSFQVALHEVQGNSPRGQEMMQSELGIASM